MKRIILTGSSGFVGGDFNARFKKDYEIVTVDLRKTPLEKINFDGVQSIVHCAALVHKMNGASEEEYFKINFDLTRGLAEFAKSGGVKQFIFLSTAHVFGDSGSLTDHTSSLSENSPCRSGDPYGRSKIAAEEFLLSAETSDFKVAIVRPPMVYGKGAKGNILNLIKLVKIFPILPLNYELNRRSILFVGNLSYFLSLLIDKDGRGIFLPQDPSPVSLGTLLKVLSHATHRKVILLKPPTFLTKALFFLFPKKSLRLFGSLALNGEKNNMELGYRPPHSTQEGFEEMFKE